MKYSAITFNKEDDAYDYYYSNQSDFVATKDRPVGLNYQIINHSSGKVTLVFARIEKQSELVKAKKAKTTKMINQSTPSKRMQILLSFLRRENINLDKLYFLFTTGRIGCSNGVYESLKFVAGSEKGYTIAHFQESFYYENKKIGVSDIANEILPNMSEKMIKSISKIIEALSQDVKPFEKKLISF